ncbi:ADP-ribosylglycohydrolase family protein [Nonomuraea rubra]|uniref:ADP-ribosylglycohydrolase family protein n=1 Tax=Nonomuraea rubra TaxID=46180 RepID=UPI0033D9FF9E
MSTTLPGDYSARVNGIVFAVAVGDALGWPQENRSGIVGGQRSREVTPIMQFRDWERNSGSQFSRYKEVVKQGEYSDDTQLFLAVARACLHGDDWLPWFTRVELPAWTLYQRGGGRAVLTAARAWSSRRAPWQENTGSGHQRTDATASYFNAGANGVAMRIAPHVITTATVDASILLSRVLQDGITTHGHPRALIGAIVHALALRHALLSQGTLEYGGLLEGLLDTNIWQVDDWVQSCLPDEWLRQHSRKSDLAFIDEWRSAVGETQDLLRTAYEALSRGALANDERTLAALGCFDSARYGAGTVTAVASAYLATRAAARPATGLLRSAFLQKADTDTLASMTASLLAALHGSSWLGPMCRSVQDAPYLSSIAEQLLLLTDGAHRVATGQLQLLQQAEIHEVRALDLERFRNAVFSGSKDRFPAHFVDGRTISSVEHVRLSTGSAATVERINLFLADGQTLTLDKFERRPRPSREAGAREPRPTQIDHALHTPMSRRQAPSSAVVEVALRVSNLSVAVHFYQNVLGIRVLDSERNIARLTNGLALIASANDAEATFSMNSGHTTLITVAVHDLGHIARTLTKHEIKYVHRPDGHGRHGYLRLHDPDGNAIQVIDYESNGG